CPALKLPRTRHFYLAETRHFYLGPTNLLLIIYIMSNQDQNRHQPVEPDDDQRAEKLRGF
ncbi:hypothetical protein, partial [Paraburkholderia sp. UYCP14C]|uniref:hypothetical protein n=1 Tax=Paraburkholderia sp. UYCP14C TaxID=2511130 RepID=UPI001B7D4DA3